MEKNFKTLEINGLYRDQRNKSVVGITGYDDETTGLYYSETTDDWYNAEGVCIGKSKEHELVLRIEVHTYGLIDTLLKELEAKHEPHWTVKLLGCSEPKHKHTSEESAFKEARRLLEVHAPSGHTQAIVRGYGVDAIVATFESVREIKETYTDGRTVDDDLPF